MSKEIKKEWERPWTTEEIVQHADNWNLACDTALLHTLKTFGDNLLEKAENVNERIQNLSENLNRVHLQVDLARNELSSLRNTQFVECRVYEDDETLQLEQQINEEVNNVPEEETIEDFREVVALGLEILDNFYDKVDITVSDSEGEDEDGPSCVYRRIDPYINRRLPLVIGSEEWHKKWHIGLEETDSENENSSEKLSDSEKEDNFLQNEDHSDVSSEFSNFSGLNSTKVGPLTVPTINTTNQDHSTSASESDNSSEPTPKNLSFAEQLAAKLGNVIREKEVHLEESEVNRRPVQKKPSDYGALFSNEPPPLDDIKEQEGIFSGGKGLFDDDEDDDLWNPGKAKIPQSKHFPIEQRKPGKFGKSDKNQDLFDDDSDDDIFASSNYTVPTQNKKPYIQANKPLLPAFDAEPPLLEEQTNTKENKKPTGGVSIFGKSDIFHHQNVGKILKQRKRSSSESSNEDENHVPTKEEIKSPVSSTISFVDKGMVPNIQHQHFYEKTISSVPQSNEPKKKKSALFDSDIFSDDLFSSVNKSPSGLFEKSVIFSDDEIMTPVLSEGFTSQEDSSKSNDKIGKPKNPSIGNITSPETPNTEYNFGKNFKGSTSSLFDDMRVNEISKLKGHINDAKNQNEIKNDSKKSEKIGKPDSDTSNKKTSSSLFDDLTDVDDLFSEISKTNHDSRNEKTISFSFDDNEDDDFDIFLAKKSKKVETSIDIQKATKKEETKEKNYKSNKIKNPSISLFGDDLDDMDDLFSQFSKKNDKIQTLKSEILSESFQSNSKDLYDIPDKNATIKEEISKEIDNDVMGEPSYIAETKNSKAQPVTADLSPRNTIINKEDEISDPKNQPIDSTKKKGESSKDEPKISEIHTEEKYQVIEKNNKKPNFSADAKNEEYKNLHNVLNVNFMESIPPPDDDWDAYSDNTFDEVDPGNDGFHSQSSSLFDNEPPSLFFDDTCVTSKEPKNNRLVPIHSMSQEVLSSNFSINLPSCDDEEVQNISTNSPQNANPKYNNDSKLVSGNIITNINDSKIISNDSEHSPDSKTDKRELQIEDKKIKTTVSSDIISSEDNNLVLSVDSGDNKKTETGDSSNIVEKNEKSENPSLFDIPEATNPNQTQGLLFKDDLDGDQTDFLFSNIKQSSDDRNNKISKNIISNDKRIAKSVSFDDNLDENPIQSVVAADSDDNMQSNISKITQKLQQISNKNEEKTKPLAVPRKLSHNININVEALLPGSGTAFSKRDRTQIPDASEKLSRSLPASRFSLNEEFLIKSKAPITDTNSKPEYKIEKSISFDSGADIEVLQSITKDRAKIPVKRRPSSRRARQKSLRDSISDFRLEDPISDEVISSAIEKRDSVDESLNSGITRDERSSVNSVDIEKEDKLLNHMKDSSEDLFKTISKSIKNVSQATILSTKKKELFKDKLDDSFKNETTVTDTIDDLLQDENLFGGETQVSKEINETQKEYSEGNTSYNLKIKEESPYEFSQSSENYSESKKLSMEKKLHNLFDSSDDDDIFKNAVKKSKSFEDNKKQNKPSVSMIGKMAGQADSSSSNVQSKKSKSNNIFDSDDDDDFLGNLKSKKNDKTKEKKSILKYHGNIFDDMDDDIFGTSSRESETKKDIKPSVINKKPSLSTSLRKLENIEGKEDPLSALLK
ncbi:WASH complex subunit 2 isoform X2 [Harmonia axyridis]|uniref:WASH complex subunit 2 isoform X2 n=1 Tax=Harmonia axyridis TaxID=115357 RepID=UPI001E275439|nr:WASH complex subunit 2 isoform X2 [Harmonia axyridis]